MIFPSLSLLITGKNTMIFYLKNKDEVEIKESCRDCALGEAYDKVARIMGLDYPGGPFLEKYYREDYKNFRLTVRHRDINRVTLNFSGLISASNELSDKVGIKKVRFAGEVLVSANTVVIAGEGTSHKSVNFDKIALDILLDRGYKIENFNIFKDYKSQSSELSRLSTGKKMLAADQCAVFGFACNETTNYLSLEEREHEDYDATEVVRGRENLICSTVYDALSFIIGGKFIYLESSEIVSVKENFSDLLIPEGHQARENSDTFFLTKIGSDEDEELILRTHATTNTIKALQRSKGEEFRGASIGAVYRKEDNNTTHLSQFTQLDLVIVQKKVSMEEIREIIEDLLGSLLGSKFDGINYLMRESFFPFTHPSYEVDIECRCQKNRECKLCKGDG
ncbi:hypothetical protein PVNG_02357 [Plasmodium vivax North Korean]|uniref:phenylalanine--tRNA ligase n=1 Tax=Plasmodium vivax North Korean TaxID=1035514 RepID=A0A0J9TLM6_PLAVI|nr:hypothetical protein PVNG_02357 [Plasmodium vivax North Korean]